MDDKWQAHSPSQNCVLLYFTQAQRYQKQATVFKQVMRALQMNLITWRVTSIDSEKKHHLAQSTRFLHNFACWSCLYVDKKTICQSSTGV